MSKLKPFVKSDFIRAIMELRGYKAECFLNDGSSFIGEFQYYNPHTGEYYFISDEKVFLVNNFNCLKIILTP